MKITVKEQTKNTLKVVLESNVSFANSIRRVLLSEVPVLAIDIVEINENKTILADEMIAHRIGLIPIQYSGNLLRKEHCDCDGFCVKCSIKFTLKKSNPIDSRVILPVTGLDLKTGMNVYCHNSLIVKLAPGQSVDMVCTATIGTAKDHAKFSPVTAVEFSYDKDNKTRATKLWVEEDASKEWNNINQPENIDWEDIKEVEMCIELVDGIENPKEILRKAIRILKEKMENVLEACE